MDYSKKPGDKIEKIGQLINSENPVISIITPYYNGGKTLMETANAVFSQTYPYFEWIIVDDGSKDKESLEKLKEWIIELWYIIKKMVALLWQEIMV